jgi:hypothetical protein
MLDFERLPRFKPFAHSIVEQISRWAFAYMVTTEVIMQQIPIAHVWIENNPKKAPKRNVMRFLNNWMAQAKRYGNLTIKQDIVPPSVIHAPKPEETEMTIEEMQAIRKANFK